MILKPIEFFLILSKTSSTCITIGHAFYGGARFEAGHGDGERCRQAHREQVRSKCYLLAVLRWLSSRLHTI